VTLVLSNCQAPNVNFVCAAIADYLAATLHISTEFVENVPWQTRQQMLLAGQIHICWICGLHYVQKRGSQPAIDLLAAPVMSHPRYQNRPIYFSDVVVGAGSRFQTFADLRGAVWGYNEPTSQSGHGIVRYHLATLGETDGYFGRVVEAGAHQVALEMILNGEIDAAAIDSTVLEIEYRRRPELANQIRVVETLGPSPIPPWVVSRHIPAELKSAAQTALLNMHRHPAGQKILAAAGMARFAAVTDHDYDSIRQMNCQSRHVRL